MSTGEVDGQIEELREQLLELQQEGQKRQEYQERRKVVATSIGLHLQILCDRKVEPDVRVEKVKPINWLGSLSVPDDQLVKDIWNLGKGRFQVVGRVNGWVVPNAYAGTCSRTLGWRAPTEEELAPGAGTFRRSPTMVPVTTMETSTDDALVTEDGLIANGRWYRHDPLDRSGAIPVRESDLVSIEQEMRNPRALWPGHHPPMTVNWPHIASLLGDLAL